MHFLICDQSLIGQTRWDRMEMNMIVVPNGVQVESWDGVETVTYIAVPYR